MRSVTLPEGPRRWGILRSLYSEITPRILEGGRISPYFVDWLPVFTPIESDAWYSIRALGLPFFPQYPVGRFFVDFADPVRRIALECDGARWHDATKDGLRDRELALRGWQVIRFPGWRCVLAEGDPDSSHTQLAELAWLRYGRPQPQVDKDENEE